MGILFINTDVAGQINFPGVRRVKVITTDNFSTVTTAGYLNPDTLQGYYINNTDIIDMWYGATGGANFIQNAGSYAEFTPSIVNGVITLVETVPPQGVTVTGSTPVAGHFATFSSATSIQDGGVKGTASAKAASDNTKTTLASVSGTITLGHIASFADINGTVQDGGVLGQAASKAVSDNTKSTVSSVNGTTTVNHVAQFSDTTGTIQDGGVLGQAAAKSVSDNTKPSVASVSAATVANNLLKAADITGTVEDSGIAATNVMLLNAANVLTGSGSISLVKGTGTEAANAVTVNNQAGVITTSALTTAGGSSYAITWTNSFITASSVIMVSLMGGTNTTNNITLKVTVSSGTATLTIYNNTAATALNGTIIIGFLVV